MPKKNTRPARKVKPVLHIYCEGEKTEPNYLHGYIDKYFPSNRRLNVIKIEPTKKNTPKELVDVAISAKKKSLNGDVFWVVYDRESEQKYADEHHATAYSKAVNKGIFVALSNVCFEIWLLLHFQNTVAQYDNYDDLRSNSALRVKCKERKLLDYDKADISFFSILTEEDIELARKRAKKMNALTEQSADISRTRPYQWNPYTDVYELLDAVDRFVAESLDWNEIPSDKQKPWIILGWNSENWQTDKSKFPTSENTLWHNLSTEEQAASHSLGYDKESWDEIISMAIPHKLMVWHKQ